MRRFTRLVIALAAIVAAAPLSARQVVMPTAVIWQDRGDLTQLNLLTGAGGASQAPGVDFRFLEESSGGTSPKFIIVDEHGAHWKAKLGEEGRSETAATRLLWAAGYIVDEDYYRTQIHVSARS